MKPRLLAGRFAVALVTLSILGVSAAAWAQATTEGNIRGYVKDEQGAILPGVTIVATSPTVAGARTAVSDAEGSYRLLNMPPADYTVTAELQGFSKFSRPNV